MAEKDPIWVLTPDPGSGFKVRAMNEYRISEVAAKTGFSQGALRFSEKRGVITPDRTDSGYRAYDDRMVASLQFVARAKRLGLSLPEIAELLELVDGDLCSPLQQRMRSMVADRIGQARTQIADLVAFTADLQRVASSLGTHTPDGSCDEWCGCTSDNVPGEAVVDSPTTLAGPDAPNIACSLDPSQIGDRLVDWGNTLAQAIDRHDLPDGIEIGFPRTVDVARLASLVAAEQDCCGFFTFAITVSSDAITLGVTGPAQAQAVISTLVGASA